MKIWRRKSTSMVETATWILSMSFMTDDMTRPVELFSKKAAPWRRTLEKTALRRSVTAEIAGAADEVIREVIGEAFTGEDEDDGEGHHGPFVSDPGGDEIVEIDDVVEDGNFEEGNGCRWARPCWRTRSITGRMRTAMEAWEAPTSAISMTETTRSGV